MPDYKYTARDPATGKKVNGKLHAYSEKSVTKIIHDQGYSLLTVEVETSNGLLARFTDRITIKDKVIFSRQLSTLIDAGMPIVQSLRSVQGQTKNKAFQAIIASVIADVEGGKALAQSMSAHPKVFNPIFISLVEAGEASGTLDRALERIADQQEKDEELIRKVRSAMIYPIIVLLVMTAVVAFMLISVLPQVKDLYEGLPGANLPLVTRFLLAVSNFTVKYWWVVLIIIGVIIFLTTKWARTLGGRSAIDRMKMSVPPIGPLFTKMYMARFARTATTLVSSGVPLIQVLEITGRAIDNVHVESSIRIATEKVKGGKSLSESLQGDENFLELVPQMIKVGEDSGSLEKMLEKVADYYEKEVDNQIKTIQTIIEPVLMIILGIVAFTIVAAILLPIYGLVGTNAFS